MCVIISTWVHCTGQYTAWPRATRGLHVAKGVATLGVKATPCKIKGLQFLPKRSFEKATNSTIF